MFRSHINKRKSKSNGLLNLALQDNEWLVEEGSNVKVDIDNKDILIYQRAMGENKYDNESKRRINKAMKILALAEAKYGGKRNMVGVKHLQPEYIDMATKLSVYWYVEKKALERYELGNGIGFYMDCISDHEGKEQALVSMYNSQRPVKDIVKTIILDPYLCHRAQRPYSLIHAFGGVHSSGSTFDAANNADVRKRVDRLLSIVRVAYSMTMSVRKDSKSFPNKRLKEVAQYLYEELEHNNDLYAPLISDAFDGLGEIELDLQGMDFDQEINDKVADAISMSADRSNISDDVRWAKMDIKYPPLVQSLGTKLLGKSKKNSDIGVNPKNMHRRLTDNKVFVTKAKRKSGTVLIDVSGSMNLDVDDIFEIIKILPASTVAIYSGESHPGYDSPEKASGMLQIVGKDGRYVAEIPEHGLNNLIDGPAIDWLGRQAEPRILVSDLQFTGVNFNSKTGGEVGVDVNLFADAMKVIAHKNILPIPDIEKAKEWVERYGSR